MVSGYRTIRAGRGLNISPRGNCFVTAPRKQRPHAAAPHDRELREAAKSALRFPAVVLTGIQAVEVVNGFQRACDESGYRVHACSIMPNHVHLVVGRHPRDIRQLVGHLKSRATQTLRTAGLWPDGRRPIWGEHGWNVFLNDVGDIERAVQYVENNPLKEVRRPQKWPLVTPFELSAVDRRAIQPRRNIGGAARRSAEEARRKRRG